MTDVYKRQEFDSYIDVFYAKRKEGYQSNEVLKHELIQRAETLAETDNWNQGSEEMNEMCIRDSTLTEPQIIKVDEEEIVVNKSKPGDFVVCNLASLSLGNIDVDVYKRQS